MTVSIGNSSGNRGGLIWHRRPGEAALTVDDAQRSLVVIIAIGLVGIVVFASQFDPVANWTKVAGIIGVGIITAGSASLVGGLVGFMFGLPHSGATTTNGFARYIANTNLDQVSDWLTKLIVGVGLVQLGRAPKAFGRLGNSLAPGFGGAGASAQAALAVVFFFSLCGFLQGYVWARLTLPRAIREADLDLDGALSRGGRVSVSPDVLGFGEHKIDESTEQWTIVANARNTPLFIRDVTVGGTDFKDFIPDDHKDEEVKPDSQLSIKVTFCPTAAGRRTATLVITDNSPDGSHQVPLSGTGILPDLGSPTP